MCLKKDYLVVGLTTYHTENLAISVPALARFSKKIILIIYNDNPDVKLTRHDIRKLGYHGKLYIINTQKNVGQLRARLSILEYAQKKHTNNTWFIFVDDDDALLNINIPNVSSRHFAIIQNMAVIKNRLVDVLRIMKNPYDFAIDNENIYIVRPHMGLSGTVIKMTAALKMMQVLNDAHQTISDIDESLSYRPPVDTMMWSALNIISRNTDDKATPIYMDTINYLATDLDNVTTKYGMKIATGKNAQQQIIRAIAKYDAAVRAALSAAAPVGQQ
ncbi:MAG: hypothetical protein E7006_03060 [Alphaproteobacteria bacterium]|nr:hypothetical protein [Alphaproteobacteria bacterium]